MLMTPSVRRRLQPSDGFDGAARLLCNATPRGKGVRALTKMVRDDPSLVIGMAVLILTIVAATDAPQTAPDLACTDINLAEMDPGSRIVCGGQS